MSKPFEHAGRSYTFTRHRGTVTVMRDDGAQPWSTYETTSPMSLGDIGWWKPAKRKYYHAHQPALATIAEAKHLIVHGYTDHGTFVHQVVWALTEHEARRMREENDANGN